MAKKFLARKYQKRQYLNACRKQKNDSFTSKPPGDDSGFFNEPVSRPIGTGRGRVLQKAHSSAYVTAPGRGQQSGNWYDGLGQFATDIPSTSGVSSDMREMNRIYESMQYNYFNSVLSLYIIIITNCYRFKTLLETLTKKIQKQRNVRADMETPKKTYGVSDLLYSTTG